MTKQTPDHVQILDSAAAAVPIVLDEIRRAAAKAGSVATGPLIGLATGGTFAPAWRALGEALQSGKMPAQCRFTHLDEYLDFAPGREGGMVHELVSLCPPFAAMLRAGTFLPVPHAADDARLAEHEMLLARAGGVELQFLGIGRNGHIAFNEPGCSFERGFHVTTLAETTRTDAESRFAPTKPPRLAVTSGVATILAARRLVFCAFGKGKAAAVAAMLRGPISPACPASAIRRHDNVSILLDREAASELGEDAELGAVGS